MSIPAVFKRLWRQALWRLHREQNTREMEEEVRWHLDMRAQELRSRGAGADDAARVARRVFGNRTAAIEASRAAWGTVAVEQVVQDLRHAVRRLRHRPRFAMAVIGVLGLGIGGATAMFSAVDAAMLRPLPFARPTELVSVASVDFPKDLTTLVGPRTAAPSSVPHELTISELTGMRGVFSHVAGYGFGALNLNSASDPERVNVGVVTPDFFGTLGVHPARGRAFDDADGTKGALPVMILSHGLWQRAFGGRDLLGQSIVLANTAYTVVGVMPPEFVFPSQSDLWIPMIVPVGPDVALALGGRFPTQVIARRAPGITMGTVRASLLLRWEQDLRPTPHGKDWMDRTWNDIRSHAVATPLQQDLVGDRRSGLLLLLGATGFVLLIACANVTNLLLSQATARRREIAMRMALGASRRRVVWQLLTETTLLAFGGAIVGIGLAPALFGLIRALLPVELSSVAPAHLDLRVRGFAVLLALVTGVTLGAWPALTIGRTPPAEIIKSGGTRVTRGRAGGRQALLAAELAMTALLLVGSGLLLRSFTKLMDMNRGVNMSHVGTLEVALPMKLPALDRKLTAVELRDPWGLGPQRRKIEAMVEHLATAPGVVAAAAVDNLPLRSDSASVGIASDIIIDGVPNPAYGQHVIGGLRVTPDYFRAIGITMLRGRTFGPGDDSVAPAVAVISATTARRYWPGVDPIGHHFSYLPRDSIGTLVIGVVADVRQEGVGADTLPQVYTPIAQGKAPPLFALVARSQGHMAGLLTAMRDAVHAVDPTQAVYSVRMMSDVLGGAAAPRQANTTLITLFACVALILAIVGVYAVVSNGVAERSRELGIRAALGASRADLVRLVTRDIIPVGIGAITLGIGAAWLFAGSVNPMLFGIGSHDLATFAVAPILLVTAAAIATLVPARRAIHASPQEIMRAE